MPKKKKKKTHRIYNHTDHELIVALDERGEDQYRLLGQSVSPADLTPRLLWTASGTPLDGAQVWRLEPGFDVHVSEAGFGATIGISPTIVRPAGGAPADGPQAPPGLHISGLGVHRTELAQPATTATEAWLYHEDEIWVTVLGAGITGLTAAHELVTRGFRVQVIERAHGSPADVVDRDAGLARFQRGLEAPDVGGIARTQWGTLPLVRGGARTLAGCEPDEPDEPADLEAPDAPPGPASLRSVHGDAVWFGADRGGPQRMGSYHAFGITWTGGRIDDFAAALEAWLLERAAASSAAGVQLVLVVYEGIRGRLVEEAYERLRELLRVLTPGDPDTREDAVKALAARLDRVQVLPTARLDVGEPAPEGPHVGLYVRVHDDLGLIAGEHGYRFFPAFYRHLRDTMRRTPIFDPLTRTFTARTTLDNLQEVKWQVIADPERPYKLALSRRPFSTITAMIEQYRAIRRDLGYRPSDLMRFSLRILRYMTSSIRRRREYYEDMSWWTFLSKPHLDDPGEEPPFRFGRRFAEALRHTPKALIAMSADHADARTQGNTSVQLLMDQLYLLDQRDSTLAGPTSTTWFAHWRTFLEQQGVRFFLGEVTEISAGLTLETGGPRARVEIVFPHGRPAEYVDGEALQEEERIRGHYIVSALDVVNLARVTRELRRSSGVGVLEDLSRLVGDDDLADRDLEDLTQLGRRGPGDGLGDRFQTFVGLQLYYPRHVSFASGHIYFAASPWGLSAISQIQFWGPFGGGQRGRLLGNLSIDIGSWRGDRGAPDPNTLDRDAIAAHVQAQIDAASSAGRGAAARRRRRRSPACASLYHLDDFIGFGPATDARGRPAIRPRRNHAPFLINVVGEWRRRPRGTPWVPNDLLARDRAPGDGRLEGLLWTPEPNGYVVHYGNLVFAGPHMRTFTRIATMESANESARHAVNAILDHATWLQQRFRRVEIMIGRVGETPNINVTKGTTPFGDYCDIWNPEMFELEDLRFLRSIDDHLMEAGDRARADDAPADERPRPAPHLFDILRLDELPDQIDDDRDALRAFDLIGSILRSFDGAQLRDLPSVLAVVERVRRQLGGMFGGAAMK